MWSYPQPVGDDVTEGGYTAEGAGLIAGMLCFYSEHEELTLLVGGEEPEAGHQKL